MILPNGSIPSLNVRLSKTGTAHNLFCRSQSSKRFQAGFCQQKKTPQTERLHHRSISCFTGTCFCQTVGKSLVNWCVCTSETLCFKRFFRLWSSLSGIRFRYCFDDLFPPVIIVFVPVLPEIDCLSPWFIVYIMPCVCGLIVVHQLNCYSVLHFPVLPPSKINHCIFGQIIWRNRPGAAFCQRHIPIPYYAL